MKNICFVFISFAFLSTSCKSKRKDVNSLDNKNDSTKFFQVNQYLQGQIKEVNATPYFIYKIDITGNEKDSTPINTAVFNHLAQQFLKPDINDESIKHFYTESIFEDETTKSFTISYSTKNKELPLQNVDILFDQDGHTVKRLFLRKFFNYSDSSAIEQLSWKPGESFQLNRSVQKTENSETAHQTTVVWNKKPNEEN
jgi:hypothetical protein